MNGSDDAERVAKTVTAQLPSGVAIRVEVADDGCGDGMGSVGLRDLDLDKALDSVGEIGALVVEKLKAARPSKTTVEFKIGFAVEVGDVAAAAGDLAGARAAYEAGLVIAERLASSDPGNAEWQRDPGDQPQQIGIPGGRGWRHHPRSREISGLRRDR
jgi:hypothetical protein